MRVSFPTLPKGEPLVLVNFISIDNEKQTGAPIAEFIKKAELQLIKNNVQIEEIVFLDTTFLNRHYDKSKANKNGKTEWFCENKRKLDSNKIKITYMNWSNITECSGYQTWKHKLKLAFEGDIHGNNRDKTWYGLVTTLAGQYVEKGSLRDRLFYLLDESAGYAAWLEKLNSDNNYQGKKIIITYPGRLNKCLRYVHTNYLPKRIPDLDKCFFSYKVKGNLNKTNENENPKNNVAYLPRFFENGAGNNNNKEIGLLAYTIADKINNIVMNYELNEAEQVELYFRCSQFFNEINKDLQTTAGEDSKNGQKKPNHSIQFQKKIPTL